MQPEQPRLVVGRSGRIAAGDRAVVEGARSRCRRKKGRSAPAATCVAVVAGDLAIAVDIAVVGHRDTAEVGNEVLDLGLRDHFLALENPAEQEPDDDQHDRDLDQREA